jgi:predicted nucleotidyltransferase
MRTKASGESTLLLLDAVQVLRAENVDYAIIGAMAASIHGVIRASRDADALLSISTSALTGLERSFKKAGFNTELRRGDMSDPISAVLALHDQFENRVDLLVGIRGFDPTAFSRVIEVPFDGESLKFVGLEDFIAMKLFAGGPQDISDAKNALELTPEPPDINLLRGLATRYGADTTQGLETLLKSLDHSLDSGLELD